MQIGVDIGGTFTDLVLHEDGALSIHKLPSTPANPASAMLSGMAALVGDLGRLARVAHGSTVATNAILERKGAKTAFITTQGFRDLLTIGRQNRPALYALSPQADAPLIPREWTYEVPERLDFNGETLTPLDLNAVDRVLDELHAAGVESVAVCFLYSYINSAHEQAVQDRAVERGLFQREQIALSSEVLPEFREYERASTVALEAYVRPVMARYIHALRDQLPESVGLRVMKSDGGVIGAERVARQAVQTALSGPAAGVIGAFAVAFAAGYSRVITLDMGGTSTDVAICPGDPILRPQSEIDGLPLRIRMLDIETVGAGGGSIARVDAGGALRVGPESAGASPGPAVYGRGGIIPTVSDANALLGRLDAAHFLGGGMALDLQAGERALASIAESLGLDSLGAAKGIIDIANANVERAVRRVSVARGYDPREFTLVAFGGAGALHACAVAERLSIPRVLVPRYPGVLCAYGLLVADVVIDYAQSVLQTVTASTFDDLVPRVEAMLEQAKNDLIAEGIAHRNDRLYDVTVDARYQGQAYELNIPLDATQGIDGTFHEAHYRRYGHALEGRTVEVVNLRVQAVGLVQKPVSAAEPDAPTPDAAYIGEKTAPDGGHYHLYQREHLTPGTTFDGSALVFQLDSTIYIPAGWSAQVDAWRNLLLTRKG